MPELPEVETVCRGIAPHLLNHRIHQVVIRETRLRWKVSSKKLHQHLTGQPIISIQRRAKYILIQVPNGFLVIHLGMSGTLRILPQATPIAKHDHFDCVMTNGKVLRFNDPRRFGSLLWGETLEDITPLQKLGPEPLGTAFNGRYLFQQAQRHRCAIKNFIMNNHIVVGVGNIYASESLFAAKIHPLTPAHQLTLPMAKRLCLAIQKVLTAAIAQGGTTLKDFCQSDGNPGYFSLDLKVYDRKNEPCLTCKSLIQTVRIGQRMSYFCPFCQIC
ncbi:MAG: bifunctional DNA-formamidopyrimidine glycosylase/DNA-(apurinic or apyrimidinic site) lyase [Candidatus Berkiellales bacterium]